LEHFLGDLFGHRLIVDDRQGQTEHPRRVGRVQLPECVVIALSRAGQGGVSFNERRRR